MTHPALMTAAGPPGSSPQGCGNEQARQGSGSMPGIALPCPKETQTDGHVAGGEIRGAGISQEGPSSGSLLGTGAERRKATRARHWKGLS